MIGSAIRNFFIALVGLGVVIGAVLVLVIEGFAAILSHISLAWR